jgi:LacI family transcriptional regulator
VGVRISEVAEKAGVSTATVSRVLTGVDPVSKELTDRVWAAVRALEYRPNRVARRLRRPGHETWALIIPDVENRFFTSIARGVEAVASEAGIAVFIGNTDGDPARLQRYLDTAIAEQVAGVILAPSSPVDDVSRVIDARIPLITVDQPVRGYDLPTVMTDHFEGGRLAGEVLQENECRRVAVIAGPQDEPSWNTRLDGLRSSIGPEAIVAVERGDNRSPSGRAAMSAILDADLAIDGLFVTNNLMTIGALREINARSLRVPDDLCVVGYDLKNEEWVSEIPVSAVNQSPYKIGRVAAQQLMDGEAGKPGPTGLRLLKPRLRTPSSTLRGE